MTDAGAAYRSAPSKTTERLMNAANVRRNGSRIRRGNGTGYADSVTDAQILEHLANDLSLKRYESVIFAAAVLHLRHRERLADLSTASAEQRAGDSTP